MRESCGPNIHLHKRIECTVWRVVSSLLYGGVSGSSSTGDGMLAYTVSPGLSTPKVEGRLS